MYFLYGRTVSGKHFFDRKNLKTKIKKMIRDSQAFMLKAPRRYGKTSLIKHVMQELNKEYLYLDFRRVPRLEIVNDQIIEYAYSQMGIIGALKKIQESAITFLKEYKTKVSMKYDAFEASVEFFAKNNTTQEERLSWALDLLQTAAISRGIVLYVFMDEFQDVTRLSKSHDLLELMRGQMQHHDYVCYMFAGSHMSLMTKIFENKKSPFYNFSRKLTLEPFNNKELSMEVIEVFKKMKVVFETDELLYQLIERTKGHPANTILILSILEGIVEDEKIFVIKQNNINDAYMYAQEEMEDVVEEYLVDIKKKEHLLDVIYRIANNEPQILEPSSLLQKNKALVDMGYLLRIGRAEYKIIDGFLEDALINVKRI